MELDDEQMPLFEWHPLAEEFDRRLRRVSASIERFWPKYGNEPQKLARQVFGWLEIHPLELLLEKWVVEKAFDGYCNGAPSYRYDHYIPYLGDDILWNLAPYGLLKLPEGEIFRRTLILVIRCEPRSRTNTYSSRSRKSMRFSELRRARLMLSILPWRRAWTNCFTSHIGTECTRYRPNWDWRSLPCAGRQNILLRLAALGGTPADFCLEAFPLGLSLGMLARLRSRLAATAIIPSNAPAKYHASCVAVAQ
jgi:hypothetical protein